MASALVEAVDNALDANSEVMAILLAELPEKFHPVLLAMRRSLESIAELAKLDAGYR